MCTPSSHRGVTLVELVVGMAIVGILLAVGAPSYRSWIQNVQIRNAAEGIQNGLQLARTEAVRRNGNAVFVLTNDAPTVTSVTAIATGTNWIVRAPDPNGTVVLIQGRAAAEGSANVTVATTPATSAITFTGFGRTTLAASVAIAVDNPNGDRNLQIQVSTGGQIRLCDPKLALATNPQGCV